MILGCAVVAVVVAWRLQVARLPLRTLCWRLGWVAVFGVGVAIFDDLVHSGPLTTGYQPGEVTFRLGAVGPNLRLMPAHLMQARPMLVLRLIALAWIVVRWLMLRRAGGQAGTAARRDLSVGAALAASWLAIWGLYSAYTWTTDPTSVTVQVVRFYVPVLGAIALLGAWLVTRVPGACTTGGPDLSRRDRGDVRTWRLVILRHVRSVRRSTKRLDTPHVGASVALPVERESSAAPATRCSAARSCPLRSACGAEGGRALSRAMFLVVRATLLGVVGLVSSLALIPVSGAAQVLIPRLAVTVGPGPPRFNSELWLVPPDGERAMRVVRTKRFGIAEPTWAPSGRRLAFVVIRDPISSGVGSIVVANADGSLLRPLARGFAPAWSPDGRTIAFSRSGEAGPTIWVMRPDGRAQHRLVDGSDPAWSPDGKRLAFTRGGWVYVMNRDGSRLRQVTSAPTDCDMPALEEGGADSDPDWSAGGGAIAFVRDCDELSGGDFDRVMVVSVEGKNLHPLTAGPDDVSPSWSPDGRTLVFVRELALYSIHADGTHVRRVFAPRGREVYQVAWFRRR